MGLGRGRARGRGGSVGVREAPGTETVISSSLNNTLVSYNGADGDPNTKHLIHT